MTSSTLLILLLVAAQAVEPAGGNSSPERREVIARAEPAVCSIRCETETGGAVAGSCFAAEAGGVLITNFHVVRGCSRIAVRLGTGEQFEVIDVLGVDQLKDIAILKIPAFDIPVVSLGNSNDVSKGDDIIVIGDPLGLAGTVSSGIVSSVRELDGMRVFQIDAAISRGSSGGPVLNDVGEVVGVSSFKIPAGENLNFAIPINYVRGLLASQRSLGMAALNLSSGGPSLFDEPVSPAADQETPRLVYGEESELRDLRKVYVFAGEDLKSRALVIDELQEDPYLVVVSLPEEAEVILVYGSQVYSTGAQSYTWKDYWGNVHSGTRATSAQTGEGYALVSGDQGELRLVWNFESTRTTRLQKNPAKRFGKRFVELLQELRGQ